MSLPMFKAAWNKARTVVAQYSQFFTSDSNTFFTSDSKNFEVRQ